MDENLYDDAPAQPSSDAAPPKENESDESAEETALLPKAFFQGKDLQIGNRCEVEIEAIHEEEVSVTYVPHKEEESKSDKGPAQSMPPETDKDMASFME